MRFIERMQIRCITQEITYTFSLDTLQHSFRYFNSNEGRKRDVDMISKPILSYREQIIRDFRSSFVGHAPIESLEQQFNFLSKSGRNGCNMI